MHALKAPHWILMGLLTLYAVAWLGGCSTAKPKPPAINAQLLPGVWRSPQDGFDIIWSFTADGGLRWQAQHHNSWMALFTGEIDVQGRWKLVGDQLTMELLETPPNVALFGEDWKGHSLTVRIQKLTDTELEFDDSDLNFRRSLALPETK